MSANRTLCIGIAPRGSLKERTIAIAKGETPDADEPTHWVSSLESLGRILSEKNMLLIEMIRSAKPSSLTELAALSGRKLPNLSRTLKALEKIGIVEFEQGSKVKKAPRIVCDKFEVKGHLAAPAAVSG